MPLKEHKMIINELLKEDPQINDAIDLEFGDLLIETTITDITEDGIVVMLDEAAIKLILEAKKQIISESYSDFDLKTRIINPDFDDQDDDSQEEITVGVDFDVSGRYSPATWGYYGGEPEEYPEIEIRKIVNYETGEDITRRVNDDTVDQLIDLAHQKYRSGPRMEGMAEAEYQGRKVQLGKPMKGDVKKSKVYVKGPKGNVVKVNFGDKNMKIKKSNPKRRKSFRARHNCDNPGPRWKARYWSCRAW